MFHWYSSVLPFDAIYPISQVRIWWSLPWFYSPLGSHISDPHSCPDQRELRLHGCSFLFLFPLSPSPKQPPLTDQVILGAKALGCEFCVPSVGVQDCTSWPVACQLRVLGSSFVLFWASLWLSWHSALILHAVVETLGFWASSYVFRPIWTVCANYPKLHCENWDSLLENSVSGMPRLVKIDINLLQVFWSGVNQFGNFH